MIISDEPFLTRPSARCLHCHEPYGTLTLLTSMVRYYRCARCNRSWQCIRGGDVLSDGSVRVGDAADAARMTDDGGPLE